MKHRILYLQPYASDVGGVDTVLLQLIEGIKDKNFKVFLILPSHSPYVKKYEELGVTVIFEKLSVFGRSKNLFYYLKNFYYLLISIKKLKGIIKKYNINIIHSHKMELMGGNIIGKMMRIPTVQTIHELPRKPIIAYKAIGYLNHVFNDKVIVLCERSKEMLEWGKYESHKVQKIYNGIKLNSSQVLTGGLRKELNLSDTSKIVIAVARLSPMKGIEYLLDAVPKIKNSVEDIKFVIVGDVAFKKEIGYKQELLKKAKSLKLEDDVFFLGLRRDVKNLLTESDLLVSPSTYDIFPTVILEAMSCSLPIVATDVGGVPEMIRDNTGIMVPPQNSTALATAILEILKRDYKEMGQNGRLLLEKEFTQEKYVAKTVAIYKELLESRG